VTATGETKVVALLGRKFVITNLVWFCTHNGPFEIEADDEYNPVQRFENLSSKVQGQLVDLIDFLPRKFREEFRKEWFSQAVGH
jgi:hypothetical protein